MLRGQRVYIEWPGTKHDGQHGRVERTKDVQWGVVRKLVAVVSLEDEPGAIEVPVEKLHREDKR